MYIEQPLVFIALIVSATAGILLASLFLKAATTILKDKHIDKPFSLAVIAIICAVILVVSALCVFGQAISLIHI